MVVFWLILLVVVVLYPVLTWSIYHFQPSIMYRPFKEVLYNPGDIGLAYENVTLKTKNGLKITGWYIPCESAGKTVLFCHGNGGNIAHRLDTINILNEVGLSCLIFDYRGYGNSQGKPSEKGTYLDAEAAWDWLMSIKNVQPEDVIIFGRSMGGSIASYLASRTEPAGLVIESSFTSYRDIGKHYYPYMPVFQLAAFDYDTLRYVKQIECPVLVIHSKADEIVPYKFGVRLFEAAPEPKLFVEIYGKHNDGFLLSVDTYRKAWVDWLEIVRQDQYRNNKLFRKIS